MLRVQNYKKNGNNPTGIRNILNVPYAGIPNSLIGHKPKPAPISVAKASQSYLNFGTSTTWLWLTSTFFVTSPDLTRTYPFTSILTLLWRESL